MLVEIPKGKKLDLEWVRDLIGDWVCIAFRIVIDDRYGLVGWGDDNAWLKPETQLNMIRWTAAGDPIGGRVIVTRITNDEEGTLLPIEDSDAELIAFRPCMVALRIGSVYAEQATRILLPVRPK